MSDVSRMPFCDMGAYPRASSCPLVWNRAGVPWLCGDAMLSVRIGWKDVCYQPAK